jgi:hypothetical protein
MVPLLIIGGLAIVGLIGCSPAEMPREAFPENPSQDDLLAHDPCSLKSEPDIFVHDAKGNPENQANILRRLQADLGGMRRINPVFTCGLDRIELLGDAEFAEEDRDHPEANGHYDPSQRAIRIRKYSMKTLYHEIGHHLQNLGILAPLVNEVRSEAWWRDPDGPSWRKKGVGERFFISDYAMKDPLEDWAETFSYGTAYPLEVSLAVYASPRRGNPDPLRRKFDAVYEKIPAKFNIEPVSFQLGKEIPLGPIQSPFIDGEGLYLYQPEKKIESRVDLSDPNRKEVVPAFAGFNLGGEDSDMVFGTRIGNRWVILDRMNYLDPTSHGSGTGFIVINQEGKTLARYLENETYLGEMFLQGDRVGYFNRTRDALELKEFDPQKVQSEVKQRWSLPVDFTALHVIRINELEDFAVVGYWRERNALGVFRGKRDPSSSAMIQLKEEGQAGFPNWLLSSLRLPLKMGERLIFPTEDFQWISYDLEKGVFSVLKPEVDASHGGSLKLDRVLKSGIRSFLLERNPGDQASLVPVEIQFGQTQKN